MTFLLSSVLKFEFYSTCLVTYSLPVLLGIPYSFTIVFKSNCNPKNCITRVKFCIFTIFTHLIIYCRIYVFEKRSTESSIYCLYLHRSVFLGSSSWSNKLCIFFIPALKFTLVCRLWFSRNHFNRSYHLIYVRRTYIIFDYGSKSEVQYGSHFRQGFFEGLQALELIKRNVPKDNTLAKMGHRLR